MSVPGFKNDKKLRIPGTLLVWLVALLGVATLYQLPFNYTLHLGQSSDDWAVIRGFGDREQNPNFSFRWTVQPQAELRLPDIGWPSRLELVGLAPRPGPPAVVNLVSNAARSRLTLSPATASQPPLVGGRLIFDLAGPLPSFQFQPNRLLIEGDLF